MTVVLVDAARPLLVPVQAAGLLIAEVAYTEELAAVAALLPAAHPVGVRPDAATLISSRPTHPAVTARLAAGATLIAAPESPRGARLLDAVAVMDRLRTDGAWEREQTHASLRRFLLEETYELFDAVDGGDPDELRGELGDVLLQVLFHARIAEEESRQPFDIDDVADALVDKLHNRSANVLAGQSVSRIEQIAQWEKNKAVERERLSILDDVPTAQPALALAQKVAHRARRAGVPEELIPDALRVVHLDDGLDAEVRLRSAVLAFGDRVRHAEQRIAARPGAPDAARAPISAAEWRSAWPSESATPSPRPPQPAPSPRPRPGPPSASG
ncbi:nucleoside triphosphate pyrophosphohydrolase [Mycolicibacillus parakoreensis]|uniref:Nucleoside triphosphate pyrophosphohydrolase n=1 Tax=Mycolicibacillus parakoreensis TaxID=1069221 RepID=A0ABY3U436_9MYCO|nr:nucleoside triphosphate pyrophosphohydrolase [Mycolicibacillus parakoreensis]MCV7315162.1 nucleoside triphosphate pyrophosphohydrolase [Mycolicibacillus parakoreensis]ULN53496.1 nucleoside triphosphate pyrophosphohydrolase [Mycolicibacillus parakoreensis]HLR98709.1 nucleoside triphosphate pyrophosphohydrolase [Mycolicibacillus parakoreensis]